MRKIIYLFLVLACSNGLMAQGYNNEWIDYSKTYYRFSVPASGLHRIPQAALQAAGLGSTGAETFQLYRNGQQVPVYTSSASGPLGAGGYIEFWGEMNDGKADNPLYNTASLQLSDKWSMISDTAAYFLTVNSNTAQNLRYAAAANSGVSGGLPTEPWFMHTTGTHYKDMINPGFAAVVGENLHASAYDRGEGWSSTEIYPGSPFTASYSSLFAEPTGPAATFCIGASGNALNARSVLVRVNGTQVMNQVMDYFDAGKYCATMPLSLLTGGTASVSIENTSGNGNDRMVVMFQEITYPRQFNFGGQSSFQFQLPANPSGNYLEISNFNGGAAPILYDVTNRRRYAAVSSGGLLRFNLQPSATARTLVLVNTDNGQVINVPALQQRNFTNFMALAAQGDYLIISSRHLHNAADPNNVVEQYKAYRGSLAGGAFNTRVIDVEDLYDQYAFGIHQHPLAVRNYLRQARNAFVAAPKYILIIGRGTAYNEARMNQNQPYQDILNMVPTFGYPASDNLLTAEPGTSLQTTPIGRLGAINTAEVLAYLNKVKEYEQAQADNNFSIANKLWMKNFTFVSGSSEPFLQPIIDNYQQGYMNMSLDTLTGAKTYLFTKTEAGGVVPLSNAFMNQLWSNGHSILSYFGHSSASTLEFNLDDPFAYNNPGKYPMMIINGCNSGNYFIYNPFRITTNNNSTLSEKFVFAGQRGSIGFIASTHFGVVNYLHYYNQSFYKALNTYGYGQSIGQLMKDASQGMFNITGPNDFYSKMHAEEICLQGDPAIKINTSYPKHDYVIEEQTVKIDPSFISVAETSFKADLKYYNLGMAQNDSITVEVKRQYPAGNTVVAYRKRVKAAYYSDTMSFTFGINPITDKGLNKLIIKVEADNEIDEMSETNNTVTKEFFIYEDEARPIYPYNYGIVGQLPQKLYASTANPLAVPITYNMEMDTTELFNSPGKITRTITQAGGLLEFDPGTLVNNTVYYWRVAPAPVGGNPPNWIKSSFVYINSSLPGYNQSHLYQHFKSQFERMKLDSASRRFNFGDRTINLTIRNGVRPWAVFEEGQNTISINSDPIIRGNCRRQSIIYNIFSPVTGAPMLNQAPGGGTLYGSLPICEFGRRYNFEYGTISPADRKLAMDFLDSVPNGSYLSIRGAVYDPAIYGIPTQFIDAWKADTQTLGSGKSLWHKLKALGCDGIDSFYRHVSYTFLLKKNENGLFPVRTSISNDMFDRTTLVTDIVIPDTLGYITSPVFGPAREWKEVHWRGNTIDAGPGDRPMVSVVGVASNGAETILHNLDASQQDFDISTVSAAQFPYMKLKMTNVDSLNGTPWQLNYWRINYTPIPEGAVAPNITFQVKDTLDAGEPLQVKLAFKNISNASFTDSIKVKMIVTDKNNVPTVITLPRQKKLAPGETLTIDHTIATANYVGLNTLYLDVNPDNDQPEQHHYNNFLYKNFFVRPDGYNPLLDVTFDQVHILNKDIVSAAPHITIKLKDESRFLALDDTSLVTVQVRYPNAQPGVLKSWAWNTDTLRFTPASLGSGENTATVDLKPYFEVDGTYELIVKGKDKSGNNAGDLEYRVLFQVINKPMISNLLNYPNPFTTSTAFVFFITGREVPQNIKIEVMTITGKVVREITKAELGPLHIGRNITEFKWDGTDQYGSKLANGVYLYRVVTNLNGKELEHYKAGKDDKTDQYFNKGYGKMVLIR